jgi:1-deoxy-D-xylulose-5-phosphate reductoisomerase
MVLVSIIGTAGLAPALAALRSGKDLAVASKEILVIAGEAVMGLANDLKRNILPVDSEHNAIFQCLQDRSEQSIKRLILTASGGPFRQTPMAELKHVTVEQALKHPTWQMGNKITIDSATMFNKGLEMIEAKWLFRVEMERVDVVVHPQSIVHSMVEFVDHSVIAQLSHSDMCFPIQYAITYPERIASNLPPLDFAKLSKLTFEAPDPMKFPALRLAREAGTRGGTLPAVMNAANEVAVEKFMKKEGAFTQIWEVVEKVMKEHRVVDHPSLEDIEVADQWARENAQSCYRQAKVTV